MKKRVLILVLLSLLLVSTASAYQLKVTNGYHGPAPVPCHEWTGPKVCDIIYCPSGQIVDMNNIQAYTFDGDDQGKGYFPIARPYTQNIWLHGWINPDYPNPYFEDFFIANNFVTACVCDDDGGVLIDFLCCGYISYFQDSDGDGYGNPNAEYQRCNYLAPPSGFVTNNLDCDDTNAEAYTIKTYYIDSDGDGFGASYPTGNSPISSCGKPDGYVLDNTDCSDNEALFNPDAEEICGNSIDENCDGIIETCPGPEPFCGDGICNGDETPINCPQDCIFCGDGICNGDETPINCPQDCIEIPIFFSQDESGLFPLVNAESSTIVYLVAKTELRNKEVIYKIYKEDNGELDLWFEETVNPTTTYYSHLWAAGDNGQGEYTPGNYFFDIIINGDPPMRSQFNLTVSDYSFSCSDISCNHNDCDERGCEGEFCEDSNDGCICMDYENVDCYDLSYFTTCSDYETELSCQKQKKDVNGYCVWTSSGCIEETTYEDDKGHIMKCERTYTKNDDPSASGWQILSWIATPNWVEDRDLTKEEKDAIEIQEGCVDGSRRIKTSQLKLPFFSLFSFIISLFLIIIIYSFVLQNK